jgi:hypothetical protein
MNIRNAILAAADHIEANPGEFNFNASHAPKSRDCGTPGCALGWIGTFAGLAGACNQTVAEKLGLCGGGGWTLEFYSKLNELARGWTSHAALCARALRLYADKYHPATPVLFPDWSAMAAQRTVSDTAVDEMVRA